MNPEGNSHVAGDDIDEQSELTAILIWTVRHDVGDKYDDDNHGEDVYNHNNDDHAE